MACYISWLLSTGYPRWNEGESLRPQYGKWIQALQISIYFFSFFLSSFCFTFVRLNFCKIPLYVRYLAWNFTWMKKTLKNLIILLHTNFCFYTLNKTQLIALDAIGYYFHWSHSLDYTTIYRHITKWFDLYSPHNKSYG